jgi:hypothetical protein
MPWVACWLSQPAGCQLAQAYFVSWQQLLLLLVSHRVLRLSDVVRAHGMVVALVGWVTDHMGLYGTGMACYGS